MVIRAWFKKIKQKHHPQSLTPPFSKRLGAWSPFAEKNWFILAVVHWAWGSTKHSKFTFPTSETAHLPCRWEGEQRKMRGIERRNDSAAVNPLARSFVSSWWQVSIWQPKALQVSPSIFLSFSLLVSFGSWQKQAGRQTQSSRTWCSDVRPFVLTGASQGK